MIQNPMIQLDTGLFRETHVSPHLVGGFNPFSKILVKLDHFPNFRGEHKKYI